MRLPPVYTARSRMSDNQARHSDCDFLIFFLTSRLTSEEKSELMRVIERGGEFKDSVVTVDWPHERSGSQEDMERLFRQACVQGLPFQAAVVGFIDDQSAKDNKVLMVESINQDGVISTSRRILARYTATIAVSCSLALIELDEAVEED